MHILIVGAGLSGLTAGVLLKEAGYNVTVVESRPWIGGNCCDDQVDGLLVHKYGPHIFHTNNEQVWKFVNRFSTFAPYSHRVLARTAHPCLLSIPYNKTTEQTIGRQLRDNEIVNLFFKDYSQKMWGMGWDNLPDSVRSRVPQRRDDADQRYFTDTYQGMPEHGFSTLCHRMVRFIGEQNVHCNMRDDYWTLVEADHIVFTGSIDDYYAYTHGVLPYRTLDIEVIHDFPGQEAAVVNECNRLPFTRTTDYSWFYGVGSMKTTVTREYPRQFNAASPSDVRYYPMHWGGGELMYNEYLVLKPTIPTTFCGRLGAYRYMNMDDAILDTMTKMKKLIGEV